MLGHLTFIVTDLVAILMRTSRYLKKKRTTLQPFARFLEIGAAPGAKTL